MGKDDVFLFGISVIIFLFNCSKAAELERLLQTKSIAGSHINDTSKLVICLDLAANMNGVDFDMVCFFYSNNIWCMYVSIIIRQLLYYFYVYIMFYNFRKLQ